MTTSYKKIFFIILCIITGGLIGSNLYSSSILKSLKTTMDQCLDPKIFTIDELYKKNRNLKEGGGSADVSFFEVGVEFVDRLDCFITPFFKVVIDDSTGSLVMDFMTSLINPLVSFVVMESCRSGSASYLSIQNPLIVFIYLALSNLAGIGLITPIVYLISWIAFSSNDSKFGGKNAIHSKIVLFLIMDLIFKLFFILLGLKYMKDNAYMFGILVMLMNAIVPCIGILVSIIKVVFVTLFGRKNDSGNKKNNGDRIEDLSNLGCVIDFYSMVAGASSLTWWSAIFQFFASNVNHPEILISYIKVTNGSFLEASSAFLVFDSIGILLSFAILILYDSGILKFIKFLLEMILLGPGSAFMIWAKRRMESELLFSSGGAGIEQKLKKI